MPTAPVRNSSLVALFLRVVWMVLGPATLFVLAGLITQRTGYSSMDVVFAAAVALVILARYLDIAAFEGETADGQPATMARFRGYSAKLLMAAAGAWLIAHML
jgi:hypothetical protein